MKMTLNEITVLPRSYHTLPVDPYTAGMTDDLTRHVLGRVARPPHRGRAVQH